MPDPKRLTAEQVATLDAYEWVSRARRGETVPTVEQWEAAARLVALTRNDAHPDSIVAKLSNVISPPKPPPLPEIEACPRCEGTCVSTRNASSWVVVCGECNWEGPLREKELAAIEGHNNEAAKLRPDPRSNPRTCGGCRRWSDDDGCCDPNWNNGRRPGHQRTISVVMSPTRDASECEKWEARP